MKSKIYQIDLYREDACNIRRAYPQPMRSYFNVSKASQTRIRAIAINYTSHRDSIGTLRIIAL